MTKSDGIDGVEISKKNAVKMVQKMAKFEVIGEENDH